MLGQLRYVVDVEGLVADGARESRGHAAGGISVVIPFPRFNVCFGVGILQLLNSHGDGGNANFGFSSLLHSTEIVICSRRILLFFFHRDRPLD